jgi:hypothetical protein
MADFDAKAGLVESAGINNGRRNSSLHEQPVSLWRLTPVPFDIAELVHEALTKTQ